MQGPISVLVHVLLDTGALGIDGNYIFLDIVNQFQLEHTFEPLVINNVSICSGADDICTKNPKSATLNVHLTRNVKPRLNFFILALTPLI